MRFSASHRRDWLAGMHRKRTVPFAVLAVALIFAACSGVNDNGTQERALETAAARETEQAGTIPPPPPQATSPAAGTPASAGTPVPGNPDPALVEAGRQLYTAKGCIGCHSIDGTAGVGPTWQNLFGSEVALADGSTVVADEAFIRESILQPGAKIVNGFANIMPSYEGQLNDDEINALIAFIQSLQ